MCTRLNRTASLTASPDNPNRLKPQTHDSQTEIIPNARLNHALISATHLISRKATADVYCFPIAVSVSGFKKKPSSRARPLDLKPVASSRRGKTRLSRPKKNKSCSEGKVRALWGKASSLRCARINGSRLVEEVVGLGEVGGEGKLR